MSRERLRSACVLLLCLALHTIPLLGQCSTQTGSSNQGGEPRMAPSNQRSAWLALADAPRMLQQTRSEIILGFQGQMIYTRTAFPMGTKGLRLQNGVTTPNGLELQQVLASSGLAVRPGDPVIVSLVEVKNDHIHFDINGGAIRRKKWYQHIQISGANGTPVPTSHDEQPMNNLHGSYLDIYFDKYVPEMTVQQFCDILSSVLDFNAGNKEEAYLNTVPPRAREAILAHQVLVGMNSEMVLRAKGRPPKKIRDRDRDDVYEEWIYGDPPQDVDFIRIVGDEVVRVETIKVNGEKSVRTEKEIFVDRPDKEAESKKEEGRPTHAPSLRRPGEDSDSAPKPADDVNPHPSSSTRGSQDASGQFRARRPYAGRVISETIAKLTRHHFNQFSS